MHTVKAVHFLPISNNLIVHAYSVNISVHHKTSVTCQLLPLRYGVWTIAS